MTLRRAFNLLGRFLLITFVALLFLAIISVGRLDRTPVQESAEYATMMSRLDSIQAMRVPTPSHALHVGFAKVNLTPDHKTSTAGYGNRRGKKFTTVHDSIYVRTIVIDNGTFRAALVSADLLIIPPIVMQRLGSKLQTIGFNPRNTFVGATHTHNSIGNWADGATEFIYGDYDKEIVEFIADKIVESISAATKNLLRSEIRSGSIAIADAVENRLIDNGPEDPLLRAIEIIRSDSSKLALLSFTAHATCLFSRDLELSRDYPGVLVDKVEATGYTFAMFFAGAVGSHKSSAPEMGWNCMDWMAEKLTAGFLSIRDSLETAHDSTLAMIRVPLDLPTPQVKISSVFRLRPWAFHLAFGEYPAYLTALRIGNITFLGAPCDFSGELNPALDSLASRHDLNIFVTSFNGGYIGYVTPSKYYDLDHYETQLMNWYAPGTGEYVQECFGKLILWGGREQM